MATTLSVPYINITGVSRRRAILASSGVSVAFTVKAASAAAASALSSSVAAVASNSTAFAATLNANLALAGVNVTCTVAVSAPVVSAPVVSYAPVNISSVNATAASAAVATQLANLSTSDLVAAQTGLLSSLLTAPGNATVSAAAVSNTASLVLAVVSASANISTAVQSSALAALAGVTSGSANLSSAAGASLLSTMAAVTGSSNVLSAASTDNAAAVMLAVTGSVNLSDTAVQGSVLNVLANVATSSANLSSSAGNAVLSSMTAIVSGSNSTLSSSSTDNAAAVMLAVTASVNLSSPTAQSSVLNVLASVATGQINVSGAAGNNIVNALSSVASFSTGGNGSALAAVNGVVDSLVSGQASSLITGSLASLAPGASVSAVTSSPLIQAAVSLNAPNASSFVIPRVPGSQSFFNPLPADVGGAGAIVTSFVSTGFDARSSGSAAPAVRHLLAKGSTTLSSSAVSTSVVGGTTGATTLSLSKPSPAAGRHLLAKGSTTLSNSAVSTSVVVSNLATPIGFTLPAVPAVRAGRRLLDAGLATKVACLFFNESLGNGTGAYDTAGVATLPTPIPADHVVSFTPGYSATSDGMLAMAWTVTGPLAQDCADSVLDCSQAAPLVYSNGAWGPGSSAPLYLDPAASAAVVCPPLLGSFDEAGRRQCSVNGAIATCPVLRVISGVRCQLWNRTQPCYWSNENQTFAGPACVDNPGGTQCLARHLTQFASALISAGAVCSIAPVARDETESHGSLAIGLGVGLGVSLGVAGLFLTLRHFSRRTHACKGSDLLP